MDTADLTSSNTAINRSRPSHAADSTAVRTGSKKKVLEFDLVDDEEDEGVDPHTRYPPTPHPTANQAPSQRRVVGDNHSEENDESVHAFSVTEDLLA